MFKYIKSVCSIALLALALVMPANAQNYNYSYGGTRVVNQNQTGLYNPSSTYIGNGTMSRSAQGLPAGMSSAGLGGLPQVNMGANVRTPGDNQYQDQAQDARHVGPKRQQRFYYAPVQNTQPNVHYYVPGQNAGGGVSTYADQGSGYNVGTNGAFHY